MHKSQTFKTIIAATSLLVIAAIAASLVYIQVSGTRLLTVQTGSMVPAYLKGDLVTVNRVATADLAVGDVITFINPNNTKETISHRVYALPSSATHQKIVTKGDANPTTDTPILPSAVVGRVTHRIPLVGYGLDSVRKPIGLALVIYVPALIIIVQELRRLTQHYRDMQPYRSASLGKSPSKLVQKNGLKTGVSITAVCLMVATAITLPVRAGLLSTASLTNNTIAGFAQAQHALLRRVEFECAQDSTELVNKLPSILLYNPTNKDMKTGGWYIMSSNGRIVTFPGKTVFDSKDDYDIEPDLKAGVKYSGDFLALFDNTGKLVDAISWGTDTSYLNPSLPGIHDGTVFRRVNLVDTNTAVDWAVSVGQCTVSE